MSLPDHPIQVILDPHVQTAIFLIGGAIIAALILFVLILADMTPINKDNDNDQDPTLPSQGVLA
jgi:hypothetical protein